MKKITVGTKAFTGLYPILVDDTQGSVRLELGIPVVSERERVEALEPSVIRLSKQRISVRSCRAESCIYY